MIEVKLDGKEANNTLMLLGSEKRIRSAINRAINRALIRGRTVASKALRENYTIKAADVKGAARLWRPGGEEVTGKLVFSGFPLKLSHFRVKPLGQDTTGSNRKPVKVEVLRTGLKPLKNAFLFNGTVFQREGAARLPIEVRYGPSIPQMLSNENILGKIQLEMKDTFEKRIDHEANRLLNGGK